MGVPGPAGPCSGWQAVLHVEDSSCQASGLTVVQNRGACRTWRHPVCECRPRGLASLACSVSFRSCRMPVSIAPFTGRLAQHALPK